MLETPVFAQEDVAQNKAVTIVSTVFPFLFWLPLVVCPNSQFGKFYANQSLLVFAISTISGILGGLGIPVISAIGCFLLSLASFIFWIILLTNAAKGIAKRIPYVGDIQIIK